eukprot:jgi/Bigna1/80219/fgenesh1_pg.69_\
MASTQTFTKEECLDDLMQRWSSVVTSFRVIDKDGNGRLTKKEFLQALRRDSDLYNSETAKNIVDMVWKAAEKKDKKGKKNKIGKEGMSLKHFKKAMKGLKYRGNMHGRNILDRKSSSANLHKNPFKLSPEDKSKVHKCVDQMSKTWKKPVDAWKAMEEAQYRTKMYIERDEFHKAWLMIGVPINEKTEEVLWAYVCSNFEDEVSKKGITMWYKLILFDYLGVKDPDLDAHTLCVSVVTQLSKIWKTPADAWKDLSKGSSEDDIDVKVFAANLKATGVLGVTRETTELLWSRVLLHEKVASKLEIYRWYYLAFETYLGMVFNVDLPPYMTRECRDALETIIPKWMKNPRATFLEIDTDSRGLITRNEVHRALDSHNQNELTSKLRDEIWENLSDGRGRVQYNTFKLWIRRIRKFLTGKYIIDLDDPKPKSTIDNNEIRFEFNQDDYINDSQFMDAARKILRSLYSPDAFGKSDENNDGKLSFIELKDAMTKAGVGDNNIMTKMWELANSDGVVTHEFVTLLEFKRWIKLLRTLIYKQIHSAMFSDKIVTQDMLDYAKDYTFYRIIAKISDSSEKLEHYFLTDRPFDMPYLRYTQFRDGIFCCCGIAPSHEKEILVLWKWADTQQIGKISMQMFITFLQIVSYVRNTDYVDNVIDSFTDSDTDSDTKDKPNTPTHPGGITIPLDPETPLILRKKDKATLPAGLKRFRLALGWKCDERVDLDSGLVIVRKGLIVESVYFGNPESEQYGISFSGDNISGEGTGDLETITVDLDAVEKALDEKEDGVKLYAVINIFNDDNKSFRNSVRKAYVKMVGGVKDSVLAKYKPKIVREMKLDGNIETRGLIFCELGYHEGTWVLRALGSQCGGKKCTSKITKEAILRIAAASAVPDPRSADKDDKKDPKNENPPGNNDSEEDELKKKKDRARKKLEMIRKWKKGTKPKPKPNLGETPIPGVPKAKFTEDKEIIEQLFKLFDGDITGKSFWDKIPKKPGVSQEQRILKDLKKMIGDEKTIGVVLKPGKEFFKDILGKIRFNDLFIQKQYFSYWWAYSLSRHGIAYPEEWFEKDRYVVLYRQWYKRANTSKKVWQSMNLRKMSTLTNNDKKCLSDLLTNFKMVDSQTVDGIWEALTRFAGDQAGEGKERITFETFSCFYATQVKKYLNRTVEDADKKDLLHHLWIRIHEYRSPGIWWRGFTKKNTELLTYEEYMKHKDSEEFNYELRQMWFLLFRPQSKVRLENFEELWALLLYHFKGEIAQGFSHARILTIIVKHLFLRYPINGDYWKNLVGRGRLSLSDFEKKLKDDDGILGLTAPTIRFFWSWRIEPEINRLGYNALQALLSLVSCLSKDDIDKIPEADRGKLTQIDRKIVYQVIERCQVRMVNIKMENWIITNRIHKLQIQEIIHKDQHLQFYQSTTYVQNLLSNVMANPKFAQNPDLQKIMEALSSMKYSIDQVQVALEEGLAKVCDTIINCTLNKESQYIPTYLIIIPERAEEKGMMEWFNKLKAKALDKLDLYKSFHLYACDEGPKLLNKPPLKNPLHEPINLQIPGKNLTRLLPLIQVLNAILLLAKAASTVVGVGALFPQKIPGLGEVNIDSEECRRMAKDLMNSSALIEEQKGDIEDQMEDELDEDAPTSAMVNNIMGQNKALSVVGGAYKLMKMLLEPEDTKKTPRTTDGVSADVHIIKNASFIVFSYVDENKFKMFYDTSSLVLFWRCKKGFPIKQKTLKQLVGIKIARVQSPDAKTWHWVHPCWVEELEKKGYKCLDGIRAGYDTKESEEIDGTCCDCLCKAGCCSCCGCEDLKKCCVVS